MHNWEAERGRERQTRLRFNAGNTVLACLLAKKINEWHAEGENGSQQCTLYGLLLIDPPSCNICTKNYCNRTSIVEIIVVVGWYTFFETKKEYHPTTNTNFNNSCPIPVIFMVALCNRADHYIFALWFLSSIFFFSSPNLSGRRLDVYHTLTHGVWP